MPEQIENSMVVDEHWGEIEYGVPYRNSRLANERRNYDLTEFGGHYCYGQ